MITANRGKKELNVPTVRFLKPAIASEQDLTENLLPQADFIGVAARNT